MREGGAVFELLSTMKLKELMTRNAVAVTTETTEQEAAEKMRSLDIGALPVCEGGVLVGMLTDRDLAVRGVAQGHDPRTTPVNEVMSTDLVVCYEDQDATEAEKLMQERKVRRVVILDREQKMAGIVTLGDLALKENERFGVERTLEALSQPAA